MITLITGSPGAGKTLYTVAEILAKEFRERAVFVSGIPDLRLPHVDSEDPAVWHEWLPEGSVLVVDECQRIWRPRHSSAQVPPGIAALETHRHRGNDLVLITQAPQLVDANIRRLVGRHIHVRRLFGLSRALVYEWDHCSDSLRYAQAAKRTWGYPRSAYQHYKSAEVHTKRTHRIPLPVILLGCALIGAGYGGWQLYQRVNRQTEPATVARHEPAAPGPAGGSRLPSSQPATDGADFSAAAWTPRHLLFPESAPIYDTTRRVVQLPHLGGCVSSGDRCTCYTQTGAPITDIDPQVCAQVIDGRRVHNPFVEPAKPEPAQSPALVQQQPASQKEGRAPAPGSAPARSERPRVRIGA